jgi:hypothetical protein
MKVKPRKLKVSGFAEPASRAVGRRMAAELDDAGLVRVERERKRLEPFPHRLEEAPRVGLVLETEDQIVGVAHDDHVSLGFALAPLRGPEVDDVVEVDVPLPRPSLAGRQDPVLQDARLEPFLDQAEDADVADPMLQEAEKPFMADRVERSGHRLPIVVMSRIR